MAERPARSTRTWRAENTTARAGGEREAAEGVRKKARDEAAEGGRAKAK
jgi:hypothetical protein